jgi:hypothetical protein
MFKSIELTRRASVFIAVAVLALAAILPMFGLGQVSAEQLTSRSATIDKSYPSATNVTYDFGFSIPTGGATPVQSIRVQWCTQPLGACVAPSDSGTSFDASAFSIVGQSFTNNGGSSDFASNGSVNTNQCTAGTNSSNEVCLTRTESGTESAGAKTLTLGNIDHPDEEQTIYVRITLYSGTDFQQADLQHDGVVAAAIVQQITVTARVQERLVFCVGTVRSVGTDAAVEECNQISGTTKDLGAVDFLAVCTTLNNPCEHNNPAGGDGASFALVATNAQEGVVVTYYAEEDQTLGATGELGSLRIPGADNCTDPASTTDQCFNSAGTTATSITAGTELFGMTVGGVNASGLTTNLVRNSQYNGNGSTGVGCSSDGTADQPCWAWDPSGTVRTIASSNDVLDNEVLLIHFAATAALTTPTGQYAVTSTYVATPTF